MSPRISVVTPTYERVATLPRLYRSLLAQDFADFDWVVLDDGSSDGTGELVRGWAGEAPFAIDYRRQRNQGKHAAVNRGVELASGEFCALMDSDDWYAPQALRRMIESWESIPTARRDRFVGVEGLCADPDGEVIGSRFPASVLDSDTFRISVVHEVDGDKIGMQRRDVLLANPFPEDLGWHVTPSLVWNRIAARWCSRFVDEVWAYKEYLSQGLSGRDAELRLRYPRAQLVYWREFAAMPGSIRLLPRLRANTNYVRYSLLTGESPWRLLWRAPRRGWALLAAPLGALYYLRDRPRLAAVAEAEGDDRD